MSISSTHPWSSVQLSVEMAKTSGADSLWAGDHLLGWFHPELWSEMSMSDLIADPDAWYDPFLVGAVLSRTSDKPFGISVTDGTRRRAADVARTALTLHHLCAGGFILGVGSGEAENLVPFGYDYERPVARIEEFLTELRALLDTGAMPSGTGRCGLPRTTAAGPPQVWVGAHGPRMLRLAGTYGDGWLPGWPMSPSEYGTRRAAISETASALGRACPTCSMVACFVLGDSREQLLEAFEREPLAKLLGLFVMADVWRTHGHAHPLGEDARGFIDTVIHGMDASKLRDLAPEVPVEILDEFLFLGSAEEIARRLYGYRSEGLEHVVLGNFTGTVGGAAEFGKRASESISLARTVGEL